MIGGGPSGLSAAAVSANEGLSTIVLESKKEIGWPVQCGESISDRALDYSGIGDGDWIVNNISKYRIFSPSGEHLNSRTRGFCIDRHLFDKELENLALSNGAELSLSCNVNSASKEIDKWTIRTSKGDLTSRSVILASGPGSHLNPLLGLSKNIEIMKGIGAKVKRINSSSNLDFYVKSCLNGGYGWYFPRGDEINIGIIARDGLEEHFNWLLDRLGIARDEIVSWHGGILPDGGPISKFTGDSVIAVGDCGGFCHPVSKGGIYGAIFTGREGARSIVDHLSGDEMALKKKEKFLRQHTGFAMENVKRRDFLAGLSDRTLDDLTSIAKGRDIQILDMKTVLIETVKRPQLLPLIKKGLGMVQLGVEWLDFTF